MPPASKDPRGKNIMVATAPNAHKPARRWHIAVFLAPAVLV